MEKLQHRHHEFVLHPPRRKKDVDFGAYADELVVWEIYQLTLGFPYHT